MTEIRVTYDGDLHCTATHGPTGKTLATDAPPDNQGKGETFSPTDLVATALGTCIATILGIYARGHQIRLEGMRVRVEKHMQAAPRRIGRLPVVIDMPAGIAPEARPGLDRAARACPVHASLRPEIDAPIEIRYPD